MKSKKFNGKLELSKATITNLGDAKMNGALGGQKPQSEEPGGCQTWWYRC
ncbi:MAG: hypothetical protein GY765_01865 [bacterium]|nr:hypothetical protein [bacterium]